MGRQVAAQITAPVCLQSASPGWELFAPRLPLSPRQVTSYNGAPGASSHSFLLESRSFFPAKVGW